MMVFLLKLAYEPDMTHMTKNRVQSNIVVLTLELCAFIDQFGIISFFHNECNLATAY